MKNLRIFSFIFAGSAVLFPYQQSSAASSSQQCTMCEYIYEKAYDVYGATGTQEEFNYTMDQVCLQQTAMIRIQCQEMMQTYGDIMYDLLMSGQPPQEACITMALCDSGSTPCTCTASSSSTNITGGKRTTTKYSGCTTCPATTYSCSCNTDYTVQSQGTSSCSCTVYCGAGKYYNNGTCTVCANGTYKNLPGNTSCTTCPTPGTTSGTTATNKSHITDCYVSSGSDGTGTYNYDPACHYSE